jgi:hypothetical protein
MPSIRLDLTAEAEEPRIECGPSPAPQPAGQIGGSHQQDAHRHRTFPFWAFSSCIRSIRGVIGLTIHSWL